MNKLILILIFIFSVYFAQAQQGWGFGGSYLFNLDSRQSGAGLRVLIPYKGKYYAIPYVYSYFSNPRISGGLSAMVPFYQYDIFNVYAIASASFNGSVSVSVNDSSAAQTREYKADGEAGVGVLIGPGCLKGMIEPRYAVVNKQIILRAGLVYFLSCDSKKGRYHKPKKKKLVMHEFIKTRPMCPAYE